MIDSLKYGTRRAGRVLHVAAMIGILYVVAAVALSQRREAALGSLVSAEVAKPIREWIQIIDLHVPDARAGDSISVMFRRTVAEPLRGQWWAEVRSEEGDLLCPGAGESIYEAGTKTLRMPLATYVGRLTCDLPPGRFRIEVSAQYRLHDADRALKRVVKSLDYHSNWFQITEKQP